MYSGVVASKIMVYKIGVYSIALSCIMVHVSSSLDKYYQFLAEMVELTG